MASSQPQESIRVNVHGKTKAGLEAAAAKDGLTLNEYVKNHLNELLVRGEALVDNKGDITIPNPWYPNNPPPGYTKEKSSNVPQYPQGDPIDAFLWDLRQMWRMDMMMDMMKRNKTPQDYQEIMRMLQNRDLSSKKDNDDFSYDKMMKWQMMQNQMDRDAARLQQQIDIARSKGDTKGADSAMTAMSTLIAAQQAQNQNFMQQFGLMTQANQNAQTTLFNTALTANRDVESTNRQERTEYQRTLDATRDQFHNAQMEMMNRMNEQQLKWLELEMDRIREEKPKDILAQLQEIVSMRETSPIMKAAFDTAFGVQQESMIGKILPQLKEFGIDKVIQDIASAAKSIITRPAVPPPKPVPIPTPISTPTPAPSPGGAQPTIPSPAPLIEGQSSTALENLRLPDIGQEAPQQTQQENPPPKTAKPPAPKPEPDANIGYSNLEAEKRKQ